MAPVVRAVPIERKPANRGIHPRATGAHIDTDSITGRNQVAQNLLVVAACPRRLRYPGNEIPVVSPPAAAQCLDEPMPHLWRLCPLLDRYARLGMPGKCDLPQPALSRRRGPSSTNRRASDCIFLNFDRPDVRD